MYQIKHNKEQNLIEISNSENGSYAKIGLNQGGNLQELILNNQKLIKDMHPLYYADTYASAILFPFANRIQDGKYNYNGESYEFEINEKALNNALHGLVYNKTFELIKQQVTKDFVSITLMFNEINKSVGFPYTYCIQLKYIITVYSLDLTVEVTNTDSKSFPFTLGWHPYFLSNDLFTSSVNFESDKKIVLDDRNITKGICNNEAEGDFQIKDQFLDDCFILNSSKVHFNTPESLLSDKKEAKLMAS